MPVFHYRALAQDGRSRRGTITATGARAAREQLLARGLSPVDVSPASAPGRARPGARRGVRPIELSLALRQLSGMIGAGMPAATALRALVDQVDSPTLRTTLGQVHEAVSRGESVADAAGSHPDVFPPEVIGLMRAGERAAALPRVLREAATGMESTARLTDRLRTALLYPALLAVFGGAVVVFILAFVAPRMTLLFVELGDSLPLPTRILMTLSAAARILWLPILVGIVVAVVAWRRLRVRPSTRAALDRARLWIPTVGSLVRAAEAGRFARTLASLLAGGVRMVEALGIARAAVANRAVSADLAPVAAAVESGRPLSAALAESGALPPVIPHLARAGEAAGDLPGFLSHGAEMLAELVDHRAQRLATLLEVLLIGVLGVAFLLIALAVMLPLYDLNRLPL